jgi:hypothetical protein
MLSRLLKKTTEAVPAFAPKKFFDSERRSFYGQLRRALPKSYVFPDVELGALMAPASVDPKLRRAHEEMLAGRKVDYALFDARMNLLCVIEIAPPGVSAAAHAANAELLASAGIQRFCWEKLNLPSTNQIMRAMAGFLPPERLDILGPPTVSAASAAPAAPPAPRPRSLTLAALASLAPGNHTKTMSPHVWERICVMANEPAQLSQYLMSLAIQDRGAQRAGFAPEVLAEIADIQAANDIFLQALAPPLRAAPWNEVFPNR